MKTTLQKITVRELVEGYTGETQEGIFAYGGRLRLDSIYGRNFFYDNIQSGRVITSLISGMPLGTLYFSGCEGGSLEVLDGLQRILSICQYANGEFSVNGIGIDDARECFGDIFYNYELFVCICEGTLEEGIAWRKAVNEGGIPLNEQELLNLKYQGKWIEDAKKYFSKQNVEVYSTARKYFNGDYRRQDYLRGVLEWISGLYNIPVDDYMRIHKNDDDALALFRFFKEIASWVERVYPNYREEMKGVNWGRLYKKYGRKDFNPSELEERIVDLMQDEKVENRCGIYGYLLSGKEIFLQN